jgi:hypothetical protein
MGWDKIDLSMMVGTDFSLKTQDVILSVFNSAYDALEQKWAQYEKRFDEQISAAYAEDESEGGLMEQERNWEEELHRERLQGVGALGLDWLMSAVQIALKAAAKHLDKSHPEKPPYDKGEGWLGLRVDEYQKRFGIDLKSGPIAFERVRELVLARNAAVHRENQSMVDEYTSKIKDPAFIEYGYQGEYVFVTKNAFAKLSADMEVFVKWFVAEVQKLRPKKEK